MISTAIRGWVAIIFFYWLYSSPFLASNLWIVQLTQELQAQQNLPLLTPLEDFERKTLSPGLQKEITSVHQGLAALIQEGREQAVTRWQEDIDPAARYLSQRGVEADLLGNYPAAIEWYKLAATVDMDVWDYWYQMGVLWAKLGETEQSLSSFQHGATLSKGNRIGLSNLYFQIGHTLRYRVDPVDFVGTQTAHENAIQIDDFLISREKAQSYYELGTVFFNYSEWQEAESYYRQAVLHNPEYHAAMLELGIVLTNQERFQEAEAQYQQAIVLTPRELSAYWLLVQVQAQNEDCVGVEQTKSYARAIAHNESPIYDSIQTFVCDG